MVDLTTYDKMLKDVYLPPVRNVVNTKTVLMKRLKRDQKLVGRKGLIPLRKSAHSGVGARDADETLPTGGSSGWENAQVGVKRMYGVVKFDAMLFHATSSKEGAFAHAAKTEMKFLAKDVKNDVNRQMFGDGTGILCKLSEDATAADDVGVAKYLWNPASKYVLHGRLISILDTDLTTVHNFTGATAYAEVDRADTDFTDTNIHLKASETFTTDMDTGDYVCFYQTHVDGTVMREFPGLRAIVHNDNILAQADGAPFNVHGLGRDANPWWKAKVIANGGTLRPIQFHLIQSGFDYVEVEMGGEVTLLLTSAGVRNAILELFRADRRFIKEGKLDGGFSYVEVNGKPMVVDKDATYSDLYLLNENEMAVYRMADFQWMDRHGAVLTKVSGKDQYEATLYSYMALGGNAPMLCRITDIQELTGA